MEPGSLVPLYRQLNGARFVHFDEQGGRLFVWDGGLKIAVFNWFGISIDRLDITSFPTGEPITDTKRFIDGYIKRGY